MSRDPDPTDHLRGDEHAGPAQGRTSGMTPTSPGEEVPTPATHTAEHG